MSRFSEPIIRYHNRVYRKETCLTAARDNSVFKKMQVSLFSTIAFEKLRFERVNMYYNLVDRNNPSQHVKNI